MNDLLKKLINSVEAADESWNGTTEKFSSLLATMEALIDYNGLFGHLGHIDEKDLLDRLAHDDDAEEFEEVF